MRDSFEKSLDGSSQFLYMNSMEVSLVGESQKIPIPNASFVNRQQLERDRKLYQQMHLKEEQLEPIQQESVNEFLNVRKWKDKKNQELQQEIRKIKEKTNFLQSSIFSKMKIQDSPQKLGQSKNKLNEFENSSMQVNKWKKKGGIILQAGEMQNIQQKKDIKSKLYSQNKSKYSQTNISKINNQEKRQQQIINEAKQALQMKPLLPLQDHQQQIADQEIEQQQQQQQEQQQQQQEQQQEEDQQQEQQQDEQSQESQESESQENQESQSSEMESSTSDLTFQTKQKYYDNDKQLRTKYPQQNFDQQNKPASKWTKKSATIYNQYKEQRSQTGLSKTKYDDSFVSNRDIKHDIEEQIENNPKNDHLNKIKQDKPIPENWPALKKYYQEFKNLSFDYSLQFQIQDN